MKIAVLSGKGGTGKTFVSVNLACAAEKAVYADCDVEEPNGHLFLKPVITEKKSVTVIVPETAAEKCSACRKCIDFCRYNALALLKDRVMVFYDVCHSCGGCMLLCPEQALVKKERVIGSVEKGMSGQVTVLTGCLNTGEASGIPVIRQLTEELPEEGTVIVDCPPGSACIVMESIRSADYCVLVAEPTLFGAHNLAMVYELVSLFKKPVGVVLNKCMSGENPSEKYCLEHHIEILARIPYDREFGRLNAEGRVAVRENERCRRLFASLLSDIEKEAAK